MSVDDVRPPPCCRCGLTKPARSNHVHRCNPTHVQAMEIGWVAVGQIGAALRDAFAALAANRPCPDAP